MASSVSKDVAIYKLTSPGDTEQSIDNDQAVGMDYGLPDTSPLGVVDFAWDEPTRPVDVPSPAVKALTNPDTGLAPVTLKIAIKVNEKIVNNRQIGLLSLWGLQDKEIRGVFPKGRFGIRNNKKPWMNFVPNLTAGWKIVDVNCADVIEWGGMFDILVTLQFGGQSSLLAANIQQLLNAGNF